MASVQTEAGTLQLSLVLPSPELWTLSTLPSWTGLCLSAGLLCPHVLYIPVTRAAHWVCYQHSLSCEKWSFISRRGRLAQIQHPLCGQCSTASSATVHALFMCVCVCVCVCVKERERKRESCLCELQHHHSYKILLTIDCRAWLRTYRKHFFLGNEEARSVDYCVSFLLYLPDCYHATFQNSGKRRLKKDQRDREWKKRRNLERWYDKSRDRNASSLHGILVVLSFFLLLPMNVHTGEWIEKDRAERVGRGCERNQGWGT